MKKQVCLQGGGLFMFAQSRDESHLAVLHQTHRNRYKQGWSKWLIKGGVFLTDEASEFLRGNDFFGFSVSTVT